MYRRLKRAAGRVVRRVPVGRVRRLAARTDDHAAESVVDPRLAIIFDADYYRETYADIALSGVDPFAHFLLHGRKELRRPSVLFDPQWYVDQNPDVAAAGIDPLDHFLADGAFEGRDPIPVGFSSAWYLDQHLDLATRQINPLVHFLSDGAGLGYNPCAHFDIAWYLKHNADVAAAGINPLAHYLRFGIAEGRRPNGRGTTLTGGGGDDLQVAEPVRTMLHRRRPDVRALRTVPGPSIPRINLVTDSIGAESLFGGVATAIVLATLWADRTGRRLRIVTRHSAPDGAGLQQLFAAVGVRPERQPELAYVPTGPGDYLQIGDDDLFLTTSWWTTASVLASVPAKRIVYILQEDERSFYPIGTDSVAAAAAMNQPDLKVVVNTEGLRRYLESGGLTNLASAASFEPSFASFLRADRRLSIARPLNLFFYARPNNPRNLFDIGVAAIDKVIESGLLPRDKWRIHFAGRGVPQFDFCDGSRPVVHDALSWGAYRDLLGRMDLGVSLMASPHPSYPPLDLAASGAVVVTNEWPGKADFASVSDRIITASPSVEGIAAGIAQGIALVGTVAGQPFAPMDVPSFAPWSDNLNAVVEGLVVGFGDV